MRIYFSGIGGVGIGPLAHIAADCGYRVIGSDQIESPMTQSLVTKGINISYDQTGNFLDSEYQKAPIDWFICTAALKDDHPELEMARKLGIRISKRDELLARIIEEKGLKLLAVAGTHGKTTTAAMLVWALQRLNVPVSYSVGTTLSWGESGKFDPASSYFVYECDEFDRNFLHFRPYLSIITNIEYDHPDTYPTEQDYTEAFHIFALQSRQLVAWKNDEFNDHPDAWLLNDVLNIKLSGEHNRQNATLVLKSLEKLQMSHQVSLLESFPGTNRRFEKLSENLYTDYGHTPTEIKATLQLAREVAGDVLLIYQPHQNIRQHEIREQYTDEVFTGASEVYWLPTYLSREQEGIEILTPEELSKHVTDVHISEMDDTLWKTISRARENNKLVLCMGAGSIDAWVRDRLSIESL